MITETRVVELLRAELRVRGIPVTDIEVMDDPAAARSIYRWFGSRDTLGRRRVAGTVVLCDEPREEFEESLLRLKLARQVAAQQER